MEDIIVTWWWEASECSGTEIVCTKYNSVEGLRQELSDAQTKWLPLYKIYLEEKEKWGSEAIFSLPKLTGKISKEDEEKIKSWHDREPTPPNPFVKIGDRTFNLTRFIYDNAKYIVCKNKNDTISFMPEIMTLQEWFEKKLKEI